MSKSYYKERHEKKIETEIKEYITSRGGLCYKIHGGDLYQETGIPDLLCCWKRFILWNRSKRPSEENLVLYN